MDPTQDVVSAEVIDRVTFADGWSVQLDKEVLRIGFSIYVLYVFPGAHGDEYPEREAHNTIEEGLARMHPFLMEVRPGEGGQR